MAEPIPPRRRWFQFGLQTMFVVVTVATVVVYWLSRPTILAHRFVVLMQAREYAEAERLLYRSEAKEEFSWWMHQFDAPWQPKDGDGFGSQRLVDTSEPEIRVERLRLKDFLTAERRVYVSFSTLNGGGHLYETIVATPGGLTFRGWSHVSN